jgi:TonB family protein
MFWIALAAQLVAPEPVAMWFSSNDFPSERIKEGNSGTVLLRVVVSPDGILRTCDVEESSGDAKLDEYTCRLTRKRAKFRAAKWLDGSPAYGVYRVPVVWLVPKNSGEFRKRLAPDVVLNVDRLPKGVGSPATVSVVLAVDEQGRPSFCDAKFRPKTSIAEQGLGPLACREVLKAYTAIPPKDDNGKPVRSVQAGSVLFEKN